jgi:hypothetical protein
MGRCDVSHPSPAFGAPHGLAENWTLSGNGTEAYSRQSKEKASVRQPEHPDFYDSERFNQLVCIVDALVFVRSNVMRSIDRVSGSFLALLFAGIAVLCGSLLFVMLG